MICPRCSGEKLTLAITCPGGRIVKSACTSCAGTGDITDEHAALIERARALRHKRVKEGEYEGQREAAERLGISGVEYSKLEHGDPAAWAKHGHLVTE